MGCMQYRWRELNASQDVFRWHARSVNVPSPVSTLGRMNPLASWVEDLAQALLEEPLPRRWAHVQGVATRALSLTPVLGADSDLLHAAGCLHDIGYAPRLVHGLPAPACRKRPAHREPGAGSRAVGMPAVATPSRSSSAA